MIETGWDRESDEDELFREAKNFYKLAFGREFGEKDNYFLEWLHRFRTGHPESFMDSTRLKVFEEMKGLCRKKIEKTGV